MSNEDLQVDFLRLSTQQDRGAVIVTEPLTTNEIGTALAPGESC